MTKLRPGGKTQIEVTPKTRNDLRQLAALLSTPDKHVTMAEAAAQVIGDALMMAAMMKEHTP